MLRASRDKNFNGTEITSREPVNACPHVRSAGAGAGDEIGVDGQFLSRLRAVPLTERMPLPIRVNSAREPQPSEVEGTFTGRRARSKG
jgi:hypothetical protein